MSTSAQAAASATDITGNPSASTFFAVAEPGFSATATCATPESCRLSAWARPWLP